jgi:putative ABC transport system permease protein
MLKQLSHSLRILFRYRFYTGFALIGLSIAVTSVWFIADYAKKSYEYDTFHSNHDRIYRLTMEVTAGGNTDHYATTGNPLGEVMSKNYPGIVAFANLTFHQSTVSVNGEVYKESNLFCTNPQILSVFTFDFLSGGLESLSEPNSVILSKTLAEKYFDGVDVIGNQLLINENTYTVRGVFQDWQENSHLDLNALLSMEETANKEAQSWFDLEQYTYVLVNHGTNQKDLNDKLDHLATKQLLPMLEGSGLNVKFHAQPLKQVYFSPGLVDDVKKGSLVFINSLAIVGILVLVVAGLNFINLTLSRSTQRSKEIRLKKILGISRKQLLLQTAMESFAMTLLVILLSTILVISCEKFYFDYTGFSTLKLHNNWPFLLVIFIIIFVLGLLGSSYSGLYLLFQANRLLRKDR